jgi:hypothetical protein
VKFRKIGVAVVQRAFGVNGEPTNTHLMQNDQFVQEALDGENAFELFTWIMNDPQWPARILPLSCAMYELLSGLAARTSRHQLCKPQRH